MDPRKPSGGILEFGSFEYQLRSLIQKLTKEDLLREDPPGAPQARWSYLEKKTRIEIRRIDEDDESCKIQTD